MQRKRVEILKRELYIGSPDYIKALKLAPFRVNQLRYLGLEPIDKTAYPNSLAILSSLEIKSLPEFDSAITTLTKKSERTIRGFNEAASKSRCQVKLFAQLGQWVTNNLFVVRRHTRPQLKHKTLTVLGQYTHAVWLCNRDHKQ